MNYGGGGLMECPECGGALKPTTIPLKIRGKNLGQFPGIRCRKGHAFFTDHGSRAADIAAKAAGVVPVRSDVSYYYRGDDVRFIGVDLPECPTCKGAWAPTLTAIQVGPTGSKFLFVCHDDGASWWWTTSPSKKGQR